MRIRFAAASVISVLGLLLAACGNSSSSNLNFLNWQGSANGENVYVYNNVFVKFVTDGTMYYSGAEYTNVVLTPASSSNVDFNGVPFASIDDTLDTSNQTIASMVCLDGYFAEITGSGSNLALGCSTVLPVTALRSKKNYRVAAVYRHHKILMAPGGGGSDTARPLKVVKQTTYTVDVSQGGRGDVYIGDADGVKLFESGQSAESLNSGGSGSFSVTLPPGTYTVAWKNAGPVTDDMDIAIYDYSQPAYAGETYQGSLFNLYKTLAPGAWTVQPFSVSPGTDVYLHGGLGLTGATGYVLRSDQLAAFEAHGGKADFAYVTDSSGRSVCNLSSAMKLREDCDFTSNLAPGDYYLAFVNTEDAPVAISAYAWLYTGSP